jgi:hypothetical protein
MPDDLDELSGGLRRLLSTAGLASRLGKKAAARVLFRRNGLQATDREAAIASFEAAIARKLVS